MTSCALSLSPGLRLAAVATSRLAVVPERATAVAVRRGGRLLQERALAAPQGRVARAAAGAYAEE